MGTQSNATIQDGQMVTFKGKPLHLEGTDVRVGQPAPDFVAVDNDLKPVHLTDFKGQTVVLVAVPSLDTPVCDLESRKFNEKAGGMGKNVKVLVLSEDLPFAQKRWCGAHEIKNVQTLSDYKEHAFGKAYGLLIRELQLLARTVIIVDPAGVVRYKQLVGEISQEPNYEEVLDAIRKLAV